MAERPGRKAPRVTTATVVRTERLTPHMVRVVLGGPEVAALGADRFTDHYVKLLFPRAGVEYPEPFDLERIRAEMPREQWPDMRTYTVRRWDAERAEMDVDFVVHGEAGLAGPWAAGAAPGDVVRFSGPGGAYAPDPEADWHLMAGDESALPAIAASLERLPEGAVAHVFIEVEGPEEEQPLPNAAGVKPTWLHRGGGRVGEALVRAVRDLERPEGEVQAFVHGEAGFVKELRRLLRKEWEVPRERLSISGYWRLGMDEDGWQSSKREWTRQVEEEQEGA
ncbi:siderophore-interacting protein [Nocardiopsis chromatogenes]|uniref:siderophore-interacting protein n=1 Tax=Nocardiopsis chromatogenes TaxID=280239 RepID=UPI00037A6734|nr:siderophore-interacting protein [Nocardiopsis chromatogenes]